MCNRFWKQHTCGHRRMLDLARCEKTVRTVKTAGHVLDIPHGKSPEPEPEPEPEPVLPSSRKRVKAKKRLRKLPGAPVAQMITPQSSPSLAVTPALQSDAVNTSYPSFTTNSTSLTDPSEGSLASHPVHTDPNHAVNNIENLIGVPCNDCLDKAAEKQALARSKSKRRRALRNRQYDDDYYLNAEGGLDDTMRDANGEPICEVPEEARWQEGNQRVEPPSNAGLKEPGWQKKRRRSSGSKQCPQVRRSRRNAEPDEDDEAIEDESDYGGKARRKSKGPTKWAVRTQGEEERKKAAEAKQNAAIDNSRETLHSSQPSHGPAAVDNIVDDSIAAAPSNNLTSTSGSRNNTPSSSNALALTSSLTSQTSHSSRIAFEPITGDDPNNRVQGDEEHQKILRSNYLKNLAEINKKTRNTFKLEAEPVSRQWKGNKGRAGKLNAMYYRLASTYEPPADGPNPYEVAERQLAQKRAREAEEDEAAELQQPATAPRPQRREPKNKKKKVANDQPQEEPAAAPTEPAEPPTTVAPQAVMRAPPRRDRAEDTIRSSRQKQKNKGSRQRAEQLSAQAAVAKARAELLAAEAHAAELEANAEDSPEDTEAVAARSQTNRAGAHRAQQREHDTYPETSRRHRPSNERDERRPFPPHAIRQGAPDPYLGFDSGYMRSSPHMNPHQGHGYSQNHGLPYPPEHGYGQIMNNREMYHNGISPESFSSSPPDALPQPSQRPAYPEPRYAGNSVHGYGGGYGTYGIQQGHPQMMYPNGGMRPSIGYHGASMNSMSRVDPRYQQMRQQEQGSHGGNRSSYHEREADQPITAASTLQMTINHGGRNNRAPSNRRDTVSAPRSARASSQTSRAAARSSDASSQAPTLTEGANLHTNHEAHQPDTQQEQPATAGQPDTTIAPSRIGDDHDAEGSIVSSDEFHNSSGPTAADVHSPTSRYPDGRSTYEATRARLSSVRSCTPARTPARGTPTPVAGTNSANAVAVTHTCTVKNSRNRKSKSKSPRKRPATTASKTAKATAGMRETLASRRTSRTSVRRITYAENSSDVEGDGEMTRPRGEVHEPAGNGGDGDGGQQRGVEHAGAGGKPAQEAVDRDATESEREDGEGDELEG